ncbi:hypothetical protein N8D56_21195 [Devosia sp. A8/3-2]|nr:hypothetical protein N8D56_21195 [Devosia sp. A8/3-2]
MLLFLGLTTQLGVFSFCLDLSQRTVGFLLNAASFAFVPQAFKHHADGDAHLFRSALLKASIAALTLAGVACAAIMLVWWSGLASSFFPSMFDPIAFLVVSGGVVVSRTMKLTLVPTAMQDQKTGALTWSYAAGGAFVVGVATVLELLKMPYATAASFLLGYIVACSITALLLRGSPQ